MSELFANDAYTTLNGAIDSSVTEIEVTDGTLFPADGEFRIRIDDEFMLVTEVDGTTWTVERAVEGMGVAVTGTAASHADDAPVRHVLTRDAIASLGGGSGILIPELLQPEDDDFQDIAMDSKWTRVNNPTPKGAWSVGGGVLSWQQSAAGGSEMDVWSQASTISAGDYVQIAFRFTPNTQWFSAWVGFSDAATWNSGTQVGSFVHWTSGTYRAMLNTYVGFQNRTQDGSIGDWGLAGVPWFVRVTYHSANTWGLSLSPNGRNWWTVQSNYSRTMTPTHVQVGTALLNPANNVTNILDVYYFRKNAGTP